MSLFFRWNLVPLIIASKFLVISQVHSAQDEPVDFAREILPILSNKCFACHGPDSKKPSQLRLDSFAAATADRDGVVKKIFVKNEAPVEFGEPLVLIE